MADIENLPDDSDDKIGDEYGCEDDMVDNDDNLMPIQHLYLDSDNTFSRIFVARSMLDTLRSVGEDQDSCTAVMESMARLSQDAEASVRSELMEQVPHIAVYCLENKEVFVDAMSSYILPMVVRHLSDPNNQVRKTSQAALLVLLEQGLVGKEDIEEHVISVILELASPCSLDDYRTEAVAREHQGACEMLFAVISQPFETKQQGIRIIMALKKFQLLLMSKMAPLLGRDITERKFLPRFCEMLTDPLFHVRKVCASNFGEVCSVVGVQNSEEVLLPKFYSLCGDAVWGVRKACAECFMTISCACSLETRRQCLSNLFVDLLSDQSRWVRMSAFQQLGPFISTFADPRLTGLYVEEDGSMVLQERCDVEQYGNGASSCETAIKRLHDVEDQLNESRMNTVEEMDFVLTDSEKGSVEEEPTLGMLLLPLGDGDLPLEKSRTEITHDLFLAENGTDEIRKTSVEFMENIDNIGISELSLESEFTLPRTENQRISNSEENLEDAAVVNNADCENCVDNRHVQSSSEDLDNASVISHASSETKTEATVPSQNVDSEGLVSATAFRDSFKPLHVHLDNSNFNTFQYWRSPLPEVDIDFDVINGAPANIHVVAKVKDEERHKVYSTYVDVIMSSEESSAITLPQLLENTHRREVDLPGVKIHTASVSTVRDTDEMVSNISSTNVLSDNLGERTLAVVNGVVQDLSGGDIGYINGDYNASYHVDGAFLAKQQDIIPQSLLENYLGMIDPSRAQTVDTEITRHCAYNLPAVAYTLGRRNWHCIKHLYESLAQAMQWKVRRTLAFSIHEMALIEGEDITHRDLLPVFDGFLKDLDEVRIGVLKHLAEFLKLLRPIVRQKYLTKVGDFTKTDNHRNWRFRQELAEQLIHICELFSPHLVACYIKPLAVDLCMDKVAEVRTVAFRLNSAIIRRMLEADEDTLLQVSCADLIDTFANNVKWLRRQIFAHLCQNILEENALPLPVFANELLSSLLALRHDPVPNVRLVLARLLTKHIVPVDYFTSSQNPHHEELIATLQALQTDEDHDVQYFSCLQANSDVFTKIPHSYTVPV